MDIYALAAPEFGYRRNYYNVKLLYNYDKQHTSSKQRSNCHMQFCSISEHYYIVVIMYLRMCMVTHWGGNYCDLKTPANAIVCF